MVVARGAHFYGSWSVEPPKHNGGGKDGNDVFCTGGSIWTGRYGRMDTQRQSPHKTSEQEDGGDAVEIINLGGVKLGKDNHDCDCHGSCGKRHRTGFMCTRPVGHEGPHIACGLSLHQYVIWDREQ